tara:strand:+ start:562 stop:1146 length:585 start_codon:yes stop_codon:yes gene_type:complete
MEGGGQMGGNQLTFEAIMTPNALYFVITLAVIGYLYQTKMVLSRERSIKNKSSNLFDKQLYLEVGFMILIGLSLYILNNGDNNMIVWVYITIPIVYLVIKSLMVFNKVTGYISEAPNVVDTVDSDLADLISQQSNSKTNTQIPVTNQNSNTVDISNALNNALSLNNSVKSAPNTQTPPSQFQHMNNAPTGFSLF